jgi:hypothetical protein
VVTEGRSQQELYRARALLLWDELRPRLEALRRWSVR